MTKILLLTKKANVTQMPPRKAPRKLRQLSRIIIFVNKITMKKAIMFPPHARLKD